MNVLSGSYIENLTSLNNRQILPHFENEPKQNKKEVGRQGKCNFSPSFPFPHVSFSLMNS